MTETPKHLEATKWKKMRSLILGLKDSMERFFITYIYLLAATTVILTSIFKEEPKTSYLISILIGTFVSLLMQTLYERFFQGNLARFLLQICSIGAMLIALFLLPSNHQLSMIQSGKSWLFMAAVFVLFLLIPVVGGRYGFHVNFLVAFKSIFQAVFYTGILFLGISLILTAIDILILPISEKWYSSVAAIIFVFLAPWFFLSKFPIYGKPHRKELEDEKELLLPKFLERLISFILIPLTAIYMVILVLYILLNISGQFWTNNLLEPLLISFSSVVIVLYLLSAQIEHMLAKLFRLIFPKILLVIVAFQLVASVLLIGNRGLNHNRYFVILFGIFAIGSGIIMSFTSYKKSNWIGGLLAGLLLISIIPPVDAFTVSGIWQKNNLESILEKHGMLDGEELIPKGELSEDEMSSITTAVFYLHDIGKLDELTYLPSDFYLYGDFETVFGFSPATRQNMQYKSINVYHTFKEPIPISDYDVFFQAWDNAEQIDLNFTEGFLIGEELFYISQENVGGYHDIILQDQNENEVIRFSMKEVFERFTALNRDYGEITDTEATFTVENTQAKIKIIVQDASIYEDYNGTNTYAQFYVLVEIK